MQNESSSTPEQKIKVHNKERPSNAFIIATIKERSQEEKSETRAAYARWTQYAQDATIDKRCMELTEQLWRQPCVRIQPSAAITTSAVSQNTTISSQKSQENPQEPTPELLEAEKALAKAIDQELAQMLERFAVTGAAHEDGK